jgi:hypothetical protein
MASSAALPSIRIQPSTAHSYTYPLKKWCGNSVVSRLPGGETMPCSPPPDNRNIFHRRRALGTRCPCRGRLLRRAALRFLLSLISIQSAGGATVVSPLSKRWECVPQPHIPSPVAAADFFIPQRTSLDQQLGSGKENQNHPPLGSRPDHHGRQE